VGVQRAATLYTVSPFLLPLLPLAILLVYCYCTTISIVCVWTTIVAVLHTVAKHIGCIMHCLHTAVSCVRQQYCVASMSLILALDSVMCLTVNFGAS
jgi:hypothetical protein